MKKRNLMFFVFFILYAAIILKLFYLQFFSSARIENTAYLKTRQIPSERGRIYDRNGLPLAVNTNSYLLYAEPKKVRDKDYFLNKIDSVLKIGEATLESKFDAKKDWLAIKGGVTENERKKLLGLKLSGMGFEDQFLRYYPEASLAAHLLGFVGKDSKGDDVGYFGIEGFYDKELTGLPGVIRSDRDLLGRPILIGTQEKVDAENGRDLYLTIDRSVQEIVKNKLK